MISGDVTTIYLDEATDKAYRSWKEVIAEQLGATRVIDTVRCPECKVYHAAGAPHECAKELTA